MVKFCGRAKRVVRWGRVGVLLATLGVLCAPPASLPAHEAVAADVTGLDTVTTRPPLAGLAEFAAEFRAYAAAQLPPNVSQAHALNACRLITEGSALPAASEIGRFQRQVTFGEDMLLRCLDGLGTSPVRIQAEGGLFPRNGKIRPLPSSNGHLLLRYAAPGSGTALRCAAVDLECLGEHAPPVRLSVAPEGITWLLLRTERAAAGTTWFQTELADGRTTPTPCALAVAAPAMGRLSITIREHSEPSPGSAPVPALVRITNRRTGTLLRPANAIDYSEQMHRIASVQNIGGPLAGEGRPESFRAPGAMGGQYYVVPGPIEMEAPAGEYDISIAHGLEWRPVTGSLSIDPVRPCSRQYELRRWLNMAERGWISGDDHIHSRLQSDEDARRLLAWLTASDVHIGNILRMGNHQRTYYEQRGFGPAWHVTSSTCVLVPGQEDPRNMHGHKLALNIKAPIRDAARYLIDELVADEVIAQGGVFGFAHVTAGIYTVHNQMNLLLPKGKGAFGEILQSGRLWTDVYYQYLNLGFRLAASAGSDTPYQSGIGETVVYAFTGAGGPVNAVAWFDALRAGRTFVTNGPMLQFEVEGQGAGETIETSGPRRLRVRAEAFGCPNGSAPKSLRIVAQGETVAEARSATAAQGHLVLQADVATTHGCWIAVAATGHDGTEAHSSPVYVVRPGFRFWNFEKVPALIAKRTAELRTMRAGINSLAAQAKDPASAPPPLASDAAFIGGQSAEALRRADEAIAWFAALSTTWQQEQQQRKLE